MFLIIRCSPIFEYSESMLIFITVIGAITAFFSATIGVVQNDLKAVIAYSTCSQLGYMVFACGLSNYKVAFFHLFNHGFFVRWYRYFNLVDVLSFRNLTKKLKLTYLSFKFSLNFSGKEDKRKWTLVQNYVNVIFFYNSCWKFILEKINERSNIVNYRKIESIWPLSIFLIFFYKYFIKKIIVKILKISKPVNYKISFFCFIILLFYFSF